MGEEQRVHTSRWRQTIVACIVTMHCILYVKLNQSWKQTKGIISCKSGRMGTGFFGTKRTGMHHWGVVLWLVSTRQNHSKVVALWAADQDRRRLNQNHLPNIRTDGKGAICFRRTQKCVSNESTRQITARQLRQPQKKRQKNYRTRKAEKTQIPTELIMPLIRKKRFLCQNSSIFPK